MHKRVYAFDTPQAAKAAVADLQQAGIPTRNISLVASKDIQLEAIPDKFTDASMDFGPAVGRGVALGGTAGLFAGLVMLAIPPFGVAIGGAALVAMFTGGALVGAWSGAIIGAAIPDDVHRTFEAEIAAGHTLLVLESSGDDEAKVVIMMSVPDRHLIWQGKT